MDMEQYWKWFCSTPGLYRPQMQKLLEYFGNPKAIYEAPDHEFRFWEGMDDKMIRKLKEYRKKVTPEQVDEKLHQMQIDFASLSHTDYPKRLKQITDPPFGIFWQGKLPDEERPAVAIVGARKCSSYGKLMATELASQLAEAGACIISGMAEGIDGYAHKAALKAGGETIGILGSGVDHCYPRHHLELYLDLKSKGAILSEYAVGTPPIPLHFPMRNRLISGMSDVLIVVEARERSGSLITADLALEQGKDVFAVPGRSKDTLSMGCNSLIEQGAGVIVSAERLIKILNLDQKEGKNQQKTDEKEKVGLDKKEKWVYSNLDLLPVSLEDLSVRTGITSSELGLILVKLELEGLVTESAVNNYVRLK